MRRWAHRMAAPAIRALRVADRAAGRRTGRRSILVEARTPMNLAVLRPVVDRLLTDSRLELCFTGGERDDLRRAFHEFGVADRRLSRRKASWRRFDLYINADPWDPVPLHRVTARLNFFHGVAGKYDLDCPTNLPIGFDRYDRVAFANADRLTRYVKARIVRAERAALIGFPKVDALANNSTDTSTAAASLGLDASRPTVIYAPTFSPASSLQRHGEEIIEALLDSGWNVIAKLHDRSFDADPKYSGGIDWRARLDRFTETHRFLLAQSGDSTNYLLASSLLVTDHSSIGFEFFVLDRPVVVFDAPELEQAARINREKVELLRSAAAVVDSVRDLSAAVGSELRRPERLAGERARVVRDTFYQPGTATDRALNLVYALLDLSSRTAATGVHDRARTAAWSEAR